VVLAAALVPPPSLLGRDSGAPGAASRPRPDGAALVWIAAVVGLAATTLHRYHDPRFLFTTALLVWLSAARAAAAGLDAALRAAKVPGPVVRVAWAAALAGAVALAIFAAPADERVRAGHRQYRASETLGAAMTRVVALSGEPETVLLGYSNPLNPGLLTWHARRLRPDLAVARLPKRAPWLAADATEAAIAGRIAGFARPGRRVIAALPLPGAPAWSPSYAAEVRADSVTLERLIAGGGVIVESDERLDAGFRVTALRFAAR
jgi:hypothetical protein